MGAAITLLLIVTILNIIIEIACGQHTCCNCLETSSSKGGNALCRSDNQCADIICNIGDPRFQYNPDSYCCNTQWDNICVSEAQIICNDAKTDPPTSVPTPQPTYTFESCIDQFPLFDGAGSLSIEIDHIFKKLLIKIRGPSTKWFGVGFGKHVMENTYSIITSENTITTEERLLGNHQSGTLLTSTFEDIINVEINGYREISCIRNYNHNIYDFTDWIDCNHKWLKIISALGSDLTFDYHLIKNSTASLFSCLCDTKHPTDDPTPSPTTLPTENPTLSPTKYPSAFPTYSPSMNPTGIPTNDPTTDPTTDPTKTPTIDPTIDPTNTPTMDPTADPTIDPTKVPTVDPTPNPTIHPTKDPSKAPTITPTKNRTRYPINDPSKDPTLCPTNHPTLTPTDRPTVIPTHEPTEKPPITVYNPTNHPTVNSERYPTQNPTTDPSSYPTANPTAAVIHDHSSNSTEGSASSNTMDDHTIIVTFGLDFWWFVLLILILSCLCVICCILIIFCFKRKYNKNDRKDAVAISKQVEMAKKHDPEIDSDKEEMKEDELLPYMQVNNNSNRSMRNATMMAIIDTVNNPNYPELKEEIENSIVNIYEAGHEHIATVHDGQISNHETMIIKLSPQRSETMVVKDDDVDLIDNMTESDIEYAFE